MYVADATYGHKGEVRLHLLLSIVLVAPSYSLLRVDPATYRRGLLRSLRYFNDEKDGLLQQMLQIVQYYKSINLQSPSALRQSYLRNTCPDCDAIDLTRRSLVIKY